MMIISFIVCLAAAANATSDVGIIWFGRRDVPAASYTPLVTGLAEQADGRLVFADGNPLAAAQHLRDQGAQRLFVVAHSMESEGGIAAQSFVADNGGTVDGLVLVAGFLQRKHRPGLVQCAARAGIKPVVSSRYPLGYLEDGAHDCSRLPGDVKFPVPVLSIGGELDGVVRVGRLAEALHTQRNDVRTQPVVIVAGMTHSALLTNHTVDGDVPARVTSLSPAEAKADVLATVGAFLRNGDLSAAVRKSQQLVAPMIEAFVDLEGSWWFTAGIDEEHGSSGWALQAQRMMVAPLPSGWNWQSSPKASSTSKFHLLTDDTAFPPYYRPKHHADVEIASVEERTLKSSNIAMLRYVEVTVAESDLGFNGFTIVKEEKANVLAHGGFMEGDDGKQYVSAIEIATKIVSRQKVFNITAEASGAHTPYQPDSLDDGYRCAEINRQAYEWALDSASPEARQRHLKFGVRMTMGADVSKFAGPWWIWNYLNYTVAPETPSANVTLDIGSYFAFAPMSAIKYGRGNHYCKCLSPARAIEWIYTDSLKF